MNGKQIEAVLNELYPLELALEWDNVGTQIGTFDKHVSNVLVSLDVTLDVVKEAIDKSVDVLIVHHPLIFKPIKKIDYSTLLGKEIELLIKHDITLYVMHTNYDITPTGLNKVLADMLQIQDQKPLNYVTLNEGIGLFGKVNKTSMQDYIDYVKSVFRLDFARFIGDLNSTISTVAIVGGSGSSNIEDALQKKVDLYITGDISYHYALDSKQKGLNILDVGHYIERFGIQKVVDDLKEKFSDLVIEMSQINTNPYKKV